MVEAIKRDYLDANFCSSSIGKCYLLSPETENEYSLVDQTMHYIISI